MQEIIRILADGLVIPIALMAAWALWFGVQRSDRLRAYSTAVMVGLTTYMLAKFLAMVWQPDTARPFELLGKPAGALFLPNAGFPSDHALFCAFLTLTVWFLTRNRRLAITMGVLTLLVCLGRVLALVHTPLDVIGGIAVACVGSIWYLQYRNAHAKNHSGKVSKNVVK